MLKYGSSIPWPEQLEEFTGFKTYNVSAMVEYFQPLIEFLENYTKENNIAVGWSESCPKRTPTLRGNIEEAKGGAEETITIIVIIIVTLAAVLAMIFLIAKKLGVINLKRPVSVEMQPTQLRAFHNIGFA